MIKILISDLRAISAKRPLGYYDDFVSRGTIETAEVIVLENDIYLELKRKYSPQSIPRDQWPKWAKGLAKLATPEDNGIGDVVARTIGAETSGAFKAFYEMTFGKPCGCNGRQKLWNQKYPLNLKAT